MHGVFPSSRSYSVSSRKIQFHWISTRDSREVVTSLMRDGTYPSRSFATLGPSKYSRRLPYLSWKLLTTFFMLGHRADVRNYKSFCNLAMSCVFSKQSLPHIICRRRYVKTYNGPPYPKVTMPILPSSLNTVISNALIYSIRWPVSVFSTVNVIWSFPAIS